MGLYGRPSSRQLITRIAIQLHLLAIRQTEPIGLFEAAVAELRARLNHASSLAEVSGNNRPAKPVVNYDRVPIQADGP